MTVPVGSAASASAQVGSTPAASAPAAPGAGLLTPVQAIDPICQMTVTVMPDTPHARVDGVDYYFCNPGCREAFLAQAGQRAETAAAR